MKLSLEHLSNQSTKGHARNLTAPSVGRGPWRLLWAFPKLPLGYASIPSCCEWCTVLTAHRSGIASLGRLGHHCFQEVARPKDWPHRCTTGCFLTDSVGQFVSSPSPHHPLTRRNQAEQHPWLSFSPFALSCFPHHSSESTQYTTFTKILTSIPDSTKPNLTQKNIS